MMSFYAGTAKKLACMARSDCRDMVNPWRIKGQSADRYRWSTGKAGPAAGV
ncbi:hypothetical protein KCP71_05215 [Salmonella enterica subsp. enterica]|nr:hypothetical protein KCP71_05215 [Salmonella enterica subsp. enterica]